MTRTWTCYRLTGADLCGTLTRLVRHLRAGDPGGRWSVRHTDTGAVVVAFQATAGVAGELAALLADESACFAAPAEAVTRVPHGAAEMCAADRLAVARAELALAIGPAPGVAAAHLAFLLDFVAAEARGQFLFTCWQEWTRYAGRARQQALGHAVRGAGAALLRDGVRLVACEREQVAWHRYLAAVSGALAERPADDTAPVNFLLFQHAGLTHRRLGVPDGADAVAALALRSLPDPLVHWETAPRTARLEETPA